MVHGVVAYPTVDGGPGRGRRRVRRRARRPMSRTSRASAARKGVRGLVVISAGFAEVGGERLGAPGRPPRDLPRLRHADHRSQLHGHREHRRRTIRLNGTFATVYPPPGRVGFLSQSGALGLAVMQYATELGLGLSSFVSVGNKADISGNDLIAYWDEDPDTDVVLLLPRVLREPEEVRTPRARRRPPQADHRREVRAQRGGRDGPPRRTRARSSRPRTSPSMPCSVSPA